MGTYDDYVKSAKAGAIVIGKRAAKVALLSLPFGQMFAIPLVSQITDWALNWLFTAVIDQGEMGAYFYFIDLRTAQQGEDFARAALEHWRVEQSGNAKEIKASEDLLWSKFKPLAKFNG